MMYPRVVTGKRPSSGMVLESRHDSGISLGPASPSSSGNGKEAPRFVFNSNVSSPTSRESQNDAEEERDLQTSPAVSDRSDSQSSTDNRLTDRIDPQSSADSRLTETAASNYYTGTGNVSPTATVSSRQSSHGSIDEGHPAVLEQNIRSPASPTKSQPKFFQKIQGAFNSLSKGSKSTRSTEGAAPGAKDKKLMAILIAKKEEAERQQKERELAHWRWEEERSLAEHQRRRSSKGDVFTPERSTDSRRQRPNQGEMTPTNMSTMSMDHSRPTSVMGDVPQTDTKTPQRFKDKFTIANEKRKSVEQRLDQQRREMEEHQRQLREKQEQDLQRANSVRLSRGQQNVLRTKLRNVQTQQRQEKMSQLKQQSMEDLSARQVALQEKLQLADLKVQQQRHEDSKRNRQDLQRKIEQSRQRQQQIEDELKTWQHELLRFKEWQGKNAEKVAKENIAKRSEIACEERLHKERLQREKMSRLLADEDEWLNSVEEAIQAKDERSKIILKQKEEHIQKSRATASAYQRMREEMKTHYSMNDLDLLSKQAALENRLMAKGPSSNEP